MMAVFYAPRQCHNRNLPVGEAAKSTTMATPHSQPVNDFLFNVIQMSSKSPAYGSLVSARPMQKIRIFSQNLRKDGLLKECKQMKSLSETRWKYRLDSVKSVRFHNLMLIYAA